MASTHKHIRSSTANKRPTTAIADGQIALNTNSTSPGLFFKDSTGATIIKIGPVHVGTTAPNVSPAAGGSSGNSTGEVWLDTSLTPVGVKIWNGSSWTNATPVGSTTVQGLLELATNAETQAGSDTDRAVTPAGLQSKISDSTSTTSSTTIASSTAVKAAYDLAAGALPAAGGTITGAVTIGSTGSLSFEGSTSDAFETTLAVTDPTADRTVTIPDQTGNVLISGNSSIVNADVNASAAIAGTKISPDFGSQNVTTTGMVTGANFTASSQGDIRLADADNSNWVALQAPTSVASNVTWTLPSADGTSNQVLKTDGSGNLGWTSSLPFTGGVVTGSLEIGATGTFLFEGSTDDGFETTLTVVNPTADRTITLPNVSGTVITTGDSGTVTSTMIADGTIVNGDINASAAIADTKLATISTAGKVSNSATTATSSNTVNAIVARDASGNFSAGTITATTFSGSGSSLTNLPAGQLSGTIPSGVLGNSSHFIGTTSIALNRASANQGLTGISSVAMPGATSGTITVQPTATAGTNTITLPATTGTVITSGDSGTVTSTMIADGTIVNADVNASAAIAGTKISPDFGSQNVTTTGNVTVNAQGDLRFGDADSSNYVALQAPATVTSNVTWTLPSADGTDGQKLSTNGAGVLSWARSYPNIVYLTSGTSATYTPTSGTKAIYVEVVGGGGGGGGVDGQGAGTDAVSEAGGGGGYTASLITNMSQTFTYTIGAGGSAGAAGANNGTNGGTSTFIGSVTGTLTANGGGFGNGYTGTTGNSTGGSAAGGTATGGTLNLNGGASTSRSILSGLMASASRSGSAPFFGGEVTVTGTTTAGTAATNFGAGGSGARAFAVTTNYAGGAGAAGVVRITEYF